VKSPARAEYRKKLAAQLARAPSDETFAWREPAKPQFGASSCVARRRALRGGGFRRLYRNFQKDCARARKNR